MKLLFDENLSRKLVLRLSELYPGSAHVADFDLLEQPDGDIWEFAQREGFVIVSADADFYERATTLGRPLKWFGSGDGGTRLGTPNTYSDVRRCE